MLAHLQILAALAAPTIAILVKSVVDHRHHAEEISKLNEIHVAVNSRLTQALSKIIELEKLVEKLTKDESA